MRKLPMKKILFIAIISVLYLGSCTERIDIELDQQKYTRIVVEGAISTDTTSHLVMITKTGDYFENQPPEPVAGATVTISSDEEEFILAEQPENSGKYYTLPDVYGQVGKEYTLRILLNEEIGGKTEYTASNAIFPIAALDSITLEYHDDWGPYNFWEVKCYVLDPPTTDFYMFHVFRNDTLMNDTITNVGVTDDIFYNGNYTNGIGVAYLNQAYNSQKISEGDVITLKVSRITEEYYDFIWQVQTEVSYQTPLFSGPPANVKGNISDGGFGFFAAYSRSEASTVVPEI